MNLGKLLSAGRSIFGGGRPTEYRLDKGFYLPKFNEGTNRFAAKTAEAKPPAVLLLPDEAPTRRAASAPAPGLAPVVSSRPLAVAAKVGTPVKPAKAARAGWTARLNPFRAPAPVAAPAPRPTTQGEFTLDAVKVVHNDLADADVEVVPVSSRTGPPAAPELPPARQAWEYLGENLLKSR
jgi:hypothetical protein